MKHMVNKTLIAVLLALCPATSSPAWADSTSDAKAAIQAAYNEQNLGYSKLDTQAVLSHTTPDFTGGDQEHTLQKPAIVVAINQLFLSMKKIHGHFDRTTTIEKINVSGSLATVFTKVRIRALTNTSSTGKTTQTEEGGGTTKDTWLRTKAGWLQKSYVKLSGTK